MTLPVSLFFTLTVSEQYVGEQLVYDFTLNRQVYHQVLTESQLFSSSLEVQDVLLPYPHARHIQQKIF